VLIEPHRRVSAEAAYADLCGQGLVIGVGELQIASVIFLAKIGAFTA
jgi:hypothetical protein